MTISRELVIENAGKIFSKEYLAMFNMITHDINKNHKLDDAEKLISEISKVINGKEAIVALAVLSVHVISVSNDIHMIDAIEELKKKTDIMIV